jgi:thiamine-monophosphate kinase
MMDLSDGLGSDLPRLARASNVGFDIELENLPVARGATIDNAISEGEDYELLFAVSSRDRNRLKREWRRKFPRLPLTRIGSLNRKSPVTVAKQRPGFRIANRKLPRGYVHFQQFR